MHFYISICHIYILYTMYIRFSTIKEKLNFLLFNMYLKEEKKNVSSWNFPLKSSWCHVIQWFLLVVQVKYYFPRRNIRRNFPSSRTWYIFVRDTSTYWNALWAGILYETSYENKLEQSKPFSVLASSIVSFSLLISFMISGLHPRTRSICYV